MSDDKVDVAVLKTLLGGLKEKMQDLYRGQADFLKEWPAHVSKLATIEANLKALDKKLAEYIDSQRWSWTTIISVLALGGTIGLIIVDLRR